MPRHADGSITISTIGDYIDEGYEMSVHCHGRGQHGYGCHHSATINLAALAARLGRDHRCMAKDLRPLFRCGVCGSKDTGFIVSPPVPRGGVVTPSSTPGLGHPRVEGPSYREQKRQRRKTKSPDA